MQHSCQGNQVLNHRVGAQSLDIDCSEQDIRLNQYRNNSLKVITASHQYCNCIFGIGRFGILDQFDQLLRFIHWAISSCMQIHAAFLGMRLKCDCRGKPDRTHMTV